MQETWVQSLGQEDPLERGRATHSSIFAWRIPGTEEPGGLQSMGLQRVEHHWSDWAHQQIPIFISIQSVSLKFPIQFQLLFIYFYYFEDIRYNFKPIYQLSHYFHFLQGVLFQILNLLVCSSSFSLICSGTGVFRLILKSVQWGLLLFLSVTLFLSLLS